MAIMRWDPMRELSSLQHDLGRLFERRITGAWAPAIDMYETDKEVIVDAELPGMTAKDIDVSVRNHTLRLKGERRFSEEVKEENYYRMERAYGSFQRQIELPSEVREDQVKATFQDGILHVSVPKKQEAKAKETHVPVEVSQ